MIASIRLLTEKEKDELDINKDNFVENLLRLMKYYRLEIIKQDNKQDIEIPEYVFKN